MTSTGVTSGDAGAAETHTEARCRPRVLVICLSDLARDPRVDRQIEFLLPDFEVSTAGLGPSRFDTDHHPLSRTVPPLPEAVDEAPPTTDEPRLLAVFEGDDLQRPLTHKLAMSAARLLRGDRDFARALFGFMTSAVHQRTRRYAARPAFVLERLRWQGRHYLARTVRFRRAIAPYPRNYWMDPMFGHWVRQLVNVPADVILVNDATCLPLGLAVARGRPVVFDAHEYAPGEGSDWRWRVTRGRIARGICRNEIPRVAGMMTVSPGLVDAYRDFSGVEPHLVTNAPWHCDLRPTEVGEHLRLVHWGGAARQRQLEIMLDALDRLDERFTLDMILVPGDQTYIDELRRRAERNPRVRFLDPVPMPELPRFGNAYDIGVYPLVPSHPNHRLALPNKFFEFVQARLAVAIGPSPEMERIARQHKFGIVARDFTAAGVADSLRDLTPERVAELKWNAHAAARHLSAEQNADTVLHIVNTALRDSPVRGGSSRSVAVR